MTTVWELKVTSLPGNLILICKKSILTDYIQTRYYISKKIVQCIYMANVHCVQKKTPTYIFNYNSGISWSIFIFFVPVEREINTLQYTYLVLMTS